MCGISGVLIRDAEGNLGQILERMNGAAVHRGPDAEGSIEVERGRFGIAHRRLAILDLSGRGRQPMGYRGRYWISYNGEVYNYRELRQELVRHNYQFATNTDTEVILAAYDLWGEDCVGRFNGMWAFALVDSAKRTVFCSRDRYGVKPLYYYEGQKTFGFASEIKQLLPILDRRILHVEVFYDYLVSGLLDHRASTFFAGIQKLNGGHNLHLDLATGTHRIERYYQIPFRGEVEAMGQEEAVEALQALLDSSIQLRLRSDVRVGTCLSGGVDSSTVAGLAARQYHAEAGVPFCAIHARGEDARSDESKYARLVADHCNLELDVITPVYEDFRRAVDEVVRCQEEPFGGASIFMQYFVMQRARELGCKVMLDGQGGDETLLGYEKYFPAAYLAYFRKNPMLGIREVVESIRNHDTMNPATLAKYSIGALCGSGRSTYYHRRLPFLFRDARRRIVALEEISRAYWNPFALQRMEMERTNLPVLLRYEDRDSMAHSVEARLPLLDFRLVEFALSLGMERKIHRGWTKWLLRRVAERVLPAEVAWRKDKFGFNAPHRRWMKRHGCEAKREMKGSRILASFCDMARLSEIYDRLDVTAQWRLYNAAVWERTFEVEMEG